MITNIILTFHVLAAVIIIGLVLVQHGKGADMGAAFGSGSAGSLFGSSGAANFLSRTTAICAAIFFITSIALTYFHAPKAGTGVMGGVTATEPDKTKSAAPAVPAPVTAPAAAPAPVTAPVATPAQAGAGDSKAKDIPK